LDTEPVSPTLEVLAWPHPEQLEELTDLGVARCPPDQLEVALVDQPQLDHAVTQRWVRPERTLGYGEVASDEPHRRDDATREQGDVLRSAHATTILAALGRRRGRRTTSLMLRGGVRPFAGGDHALAPNSRRSERDRLPPEITAIAEAIWPTVTVPARSNAEGEVADRDILELLQ
jgi:hypothetical protein